MALGLQDAGLGMRTAIWIWDLLLFASYEASGIPLPSGYQLSMLLIMNQSIGSRLWLVVCPMKGQEVGLSDTFLACSAHARFIYIVI